MAQIPPFIKWPLRVLKYVWLTVWTIYQIALGVLLVGIIWAVFQVAQYFHILDIRALRSNPPHTTAFIEADHMRLHNEFMTAQRNGVRPLPDTTIRWTWVPLDSIPKTLVDLVLVAEDSKFYSHDGFDLEEIEYAMVANHQANKPMRGASTITQQVAKNLYLASDKEMQRKAREAAISLLLEHYLGKDRILETYLNVAQFGHGVFGVREAARYHFGEELENLTQDQMLSLVCLLPSPEHWNPRHPSPGFIMHKQQVLRNYALFKGIKSMQDSTAPDWMHGVYDSLGSLLSEQKWKKLRKGPMVEPDSSDEEEDDLSPDANLTPNPSP